MTDESEEINPVLGIPDSEWQRQRGEALSEEIRKPREWFIFDGHTVQPKVQGPDIAYADNVHVIEYSAYEIERQRSEVRGESLLSVTKELAEARAEIERWAKAYEIAHSQAMSNGGEVMRLKGERLMSTAGLNARIMSLETLLKSIAASDPKLAASIDACVPGGLK